MKSKKQQIFEAATRLFRDRGYAATSMRDLAKAVDLKASSLYNHIGSKEEILQEICFKNAKRFQEGMSEIEGMNTSSTEKLAALIRLHIRIATEDVTSVTAFNDEWRHLSEPMLSEFKAQRRDYENRFKTIIQQGMEDGEFKALNPSIVLYSMLSSVRWLYDWFKQGKSITPKELEDHLSQLLLQGLRH